jgi:hypothetical protein
MNNMGNCFPSQPLLLAAYDIFPALLIDFRYLNNTPITADTTVKIVPTMVAISAGFVRPSLDCVVAIDNRLEVVSVVDGTVVVDEGEDVLVRVCPFAVAAGITAAVADSVTVLAIVNSEEVARFDGDIIMIR